MTYKEKESKKDTFQGLVMSNADTNYLVNKLARSAPSDNVELDEEGVKKLFDLYLSDLSDQIPADLLIAGTIPVKDMVLIPAKKENGTALIPPTNARILVFDDYEVLPDKEQWENILDIKKAAGVLQLIPTQEGRFTMLIPFFLIYGKDEIHFRTGGFAGIPELKSDAEKKSMHYAMKKEAHKYVPTILSYLSMWYAVQLALLHPLTHTIFEKPEIRKLAGKEKRVLPKDEEGRTVKYVKYHHIRPQDFEFDLASLQLGKEQEERMRGYTRKTLIWHVAGHFHTYQTKDGKVEKFVEGFWKGPLKDYRKNLDRQRREIATPEKEVLSVPVTI